MKRAALALLMAWFTALAAYAQAPAAPVITSKLAPSTLAVGELAKLTIEVDAPASTEVSLPEQPFGGLELTDRHVRTELRGDRLHTTYELDLLALDAGDPELPPLTLRFVSASGELSSGQTTAQQLHVRSLIANEPNAEPKGATKPLSVMRDDYTIAWVGAGLLAVAVIAIVTLLISRWLKRRPKAPEPAPPPRPAWELAVARLHALLAQKDELIANDRSQEFVDGVSDALREYLGKRYGFDGLERTTHELLATLERIRPHRLTLATVSEILERCDLVKFARVKPNAEECQELWNGALSLVRTTTPATVEEPLRASPSQVPPARSSQLPPPRSSQVPPASPSHAPPRSPEASVRGWSSAKEPPAPSTPPQPEEDPWLQAPTRAQPILPKPPIGSADELWPDDDLPADDELPDAPTVVTRGPDAARSSVFPRARRDSDPEDSLVPSKPASAAPRTSSFPAAKREFSLPPSLSGNPPPEPASARPPIAPRRSSVPPPSPNASMRPRPSTPPPPPPRRPPAPKKRDDSGES